MKKRVSHDDLERVAFSIQEFADTVGIGRSTTYGLIAAGKIRVTKVGKRSLITAAERARFLAAQGEAA